MRVWRKAAAVGAATAITMGSAAFATPGIAAADTISTSCGGSVTAEIGDTISASTSVLGLNLGSVNLGTVQEAGTSVLSKTVGLLQQLLCKVTVTVTTAVDDVADGVGSVTPDPLKPVTDPVTGAVKGTTEQLRQASGATQPAAPVDPPLSPTDPQTGGGTKAPGGSTTPPGTVVSQPGNPGTTSPVTGGSPTGFGTTPFMSGPMNGFGGLPGSGGSLFDTAPGLRYGTGFDGYAPQFGLLGDEGIGGETGPDIRNAGSANALDPVPDEGIGLPMLLAVLALAGASAGLVRTWVLRSAATTAV